MIKLKNLMSEKKWQNRGKTGAPRDMDPFAYGVGHTSKKKKKGEDWWDSQSADQQAAYIKSHPGTSRKVTAKKSGGDDEPQKMVDPHHTPYGPEPYNPYTSGDNWGRDKDYGRPGHKSYDSSHIERDRKARQQDTQAVKQELEKAPPEAKSWYEKTIGTKVDKALSYAEDVADWWENAGYEEDEKNPFPKWGETETRSTETIEINGKQYRPIGDKK
tara:strand:- start:67 stop:714 length:648 start_codon:yes stop_codon:yes gene_type:complete